MWGKLHRELIVITIISVRFGRSSESKARKVIEDKQREQELAAQAAAARQKTVSYRVEQILAEDTAKAE